MKKKKKKKKKEEEEEEEEKKKMWCVVYYLLLLFINYYGKTLLNAKTKVLETPIERFIEIGMDSGKIFKKVNIYILCKK